MDLVLMVSLPVSNELGLRVHSGAYDFGQFGLHGP